MLNLAAPVLLTLSAATAAPPSVESLFVGFSVVVCMRSGANPVRVREIAKAKDWQEVPLEAVPGHAPQFLAEGNAYKPNQAWRFAYQGATFWVRLLSSPDQPGLRYCSVTAQHLNAAAVNAGFSYGVETGSAPDLATMPVKQYRFANYPGTATYDLSGVPDGVVHTVSFIPAIAARR